MLSAAPPSIEKKQASFNKNWKAWAWAAQPAGYWERTIWPLQLVQNSLKL
jgi:hypothetical protein